ncbi:cell surface protein [Methanosarcina siciliae C2J]|uniref:Cell surface protein n=1 Tax=Methanosarcina siciliae C2J TaxID=1434118 RepID=A0A0E3PTQ9_9EURY|nr:NosD domain-containing protein [Methanosarcina siciliae]AKB38919.1 cell surface protein [Methanosarcina siciliae C2J]
MKRTLDYIRKGLKVRPRIFICCVLAFCFLLLVFTGSTSAKKVTVDAQGWGDSRSIQAAVDMAEDGDTVFVYAGEYNENVVVDKYLTLIAEDRDASSTLRKSDDSDSSEFGKIVVEADKITEEFGLEPMYETLMYISPSIKKASSDYLPLILDASGQIDLLEEIKNGPFSESEKLLLEESVREIRRKYPVGFVRRDRVVYAYLISSERELDDDNEGNITGRAELENMTENVSTNISENIIENRSFAPSVKLYLTEDENRTLDRIQGVSMAYRDLFQRIREVDLKDTGLREVDLKDTDFGQYEVDEEVIEYGNSVPGDDAGEFVIFQSRPLDNVIIIPIDPDFPALEINADNVTAQGFVIKSDLGERPETGLLLLGAGNCTLLKNRVSGTKHGIFLRNCTDCVLESNHLDSNNEALVIENSNRSLFRANIVERGNNGIYLKDSDENRLFENRAEDFSSGFRIEESMGNTIESNIAACNIQAGFYLLKAAGNQLGNNSANNNFQCGISLETSSGNTLVHNELWANMHGISLEDASNENSVHDNQLFECEKGLLVSKDSTENRIYNNKIRLRKIQDKSWIGEILDQIFI